MTENDRTVTCKGCGFTEPARHQHVWSCGRCGVEVCADCSDDGINCRDCEMAIFSGEEEDE